MDEVRVVFDTDPAAVGYIPCGWIAEDACSAPACVDKKYAEACRLIDSLIAIGDDLEGLVA